MKDFNVDYDILYEVWLMYNCGIAHGLSGLESIKEIEKNNNDNWNKALRFFISYGLNIISFNMDKGNI
jgi:hypothetical protein